MRCKKLLIHPLTISNIYEQYFITVPVKQNTVSQIVNGKDCSTYKQFIINNSNINNRVLIPVIF